MAPNHSNHSTGHETTDADVRPIVLVGAALAIVAAIVLVISVGLFRFLVERPVPTPANPMAAESAQFPPPPRIEVNPSTELEQLRQQEDQTLSTYGWIDRKAGRVRIPIDRAIDLQLQRGFPVRKEASKP
ncbi:MAG TPA: hypothetical protein VGG72_06085 [Bryobacteraceae bacterium]|jgi:hypothetical protein